MYLLANQKINRLIPFLKTSIQQQIHELRSVVNILRQSQKIQSTVEDDDADDDDEDEVGQEDEHAGDLADPAHRPGLDLLPRIGLTPPSKAGLDLPWPLLVQGNFLCWPQKRALSEKGCWWDPGSRLKHQIREIYLERIKAEHFICNMKAAGNGFTQTLIQVCHG